MANLLSFLKRKTGPQIEAGGTDFQARTAQNLAKAATGATMPDGQRFANLPPVRRTSGGDSRGGDDWGRSILNDPRELYWGALPNKIEPKQAMWMVRAAMGGDLWQFWRLTENMLNTWPKLAMASHQLREAVSYVRYVASPFEAVAGEPPTETAIEKRNLVQRALDSLMPNQFNDERNKAGMIYNFTDAVLRGIELEEIIWKDVERAPGGGWQRLPKSTAWTHPRHFTFNQEGSLVIFDSAHTLNVGDMRKFGKGEGELPDPNKMLCAQFMSRSGSSHVNGFAMQLVWWWCARQYGLDYVLLMAQNFGRPFVDMTYKPQISDAEKMRMVSEIIKGLGNRVLAHQEGTTLEIIAPQNLGDENPQRWLIEESDREALYLLLGQTGSTISTPNKLGGQDTHNEVKQERVAGIAEWVAQNPLEQFARAVLRVNYGNEDECPKFKPDFTKPLNSEEVGKLFTSIKTSGAPVKVSELYGKTGFTAPKEKDEVFQDGVIKIFEAPITDSEKQQKQFDQQLEMQQAQLELGESRPETKPEPGRASDATKPTNYRRLLSSASDSDLDELEKLVTAAERAPHPNGELTALELKVQTMKGRR